VSDGQTDRRTDGQTDGNAIAITALAMRALRRAVKRVRPDVYSNRVVNEWNILDEEIISEFLLAGFKRKLDRHLRGKRGYT